MENSYILNCFIHKDYKVPYNLTNSSSVESISDKSKAMGLGAVTGILLALTIDVLMSLEINKRGSFIKTVSKIFSAETVSRTLILTVIVLATPILLLFLLLALVYKVLCSVVIRQKDENFVGFLDSFDVFWSLEDDATKSVINVLGIIEADSPQAIANNIKEKLYNLFPNEETRKIFYRRNEEYGFYYWRRYSLIDMDQYVEVIEFPKKSDRLDVVDLENFMSDLQDQPLPYKDEGLFKIIITRQRIGNYGDLKGDYGIIFRVHHSVGDGVALIEFLCQTFADKIDNYPLRMFSLPDNYNTDSPSNLLDMMQKLLDIPLCFVDGILRKPDKNAFHGPTLIGKKVFKWTESDENLLKMVKDIKDNIDQMTFSDVLLTTLSSGLRDLLSEKGHVPEDVAVVLPVRFPKSSAVKNDSLLKNDFSVTILDVPVEDKCNLHVIKTRCNKLRKSADPLTNFYFLKLVCSVLPKKVLQPLLYSSQASMVFSNMPGPYRLSICGGNILKSLVFFVPHKGNTGLGVTALCYGGVLRFAAMADSALVSGPEDLAIILDGMVHEIRRLHKQYG